MSTYRTTHDCDLTVTGSDKVKIYEPLWFRKRWRRYRFQTPPVKSAVWLIHFMEASGVLFLE
jgi:hypothetical protein